MRNKSSKPRPSLGNQLGSKRGLESTRISCSDIYSGKLTMEVVRLRCALCEIRCLRDHFGELKRNERFDAVRVAEHEPQHFEHPHAHCILGGREEFAYTFAEFLKMQQRRYLYFVFILT